VGGGWCLCFGGGGGGVGGGGGGVWGVFGVGGGGEPPKTGISAMSIIKKKQQCRVKGRSKKQLSENQKACL